MLPQITTDMIALIATIDIGRHGGKDGVRSAEYGVRSAEYGVRSHGVRVTEYGVTESRSTESRRSTEYGVCL